MREIKYLYCPYCQNLLWVVDDKELPVMCCGEEMEVLKANTTDGAKEKHVPEVFESENQYMVKVGVEPHPMIDEHYIMWVAMETNRGLYYKFLKPGDLPEVVFEKNGEKVIAFYEYCNVHGLWKKEMGGK